MKDRITVYGKIGFEIENRTKKHSQQASWKKVAMINFGCNMSDYYAWFIKKRYNLELIKPIRGTHVTLINDSLRDITQNGKISLSEASLLWDKVKAKWDGQKVPITLLLDPRFGKEYWWLRLDDETKTNLNGIRAELGLGKPFFDFHMTIGTVNEKNSLHNEYIKNGIISGLIW